MNMNNNYCYYCYSCNSCYSCDYCKNLKMTEYNLFCYAEKCNDGDSFQQKRYRVFNKDVGEERCKEIRNLIYNDILEGFKLKLEGDNWEEEWKKLTEEQLKRLQEIPEFDSEVFKGITGIDVEEKEKDLTGETIEVEIEGKTYKAKLKNI